MLELIRNLETKYKCESFEGFNTKTKFSDIIEYVKTKCDNYYFETEQSNPVLVVKNCKDKDLKSHFVFVVELGDYRKVLICRKAEE